MLPQNAVQIFKIEKQNGQDTIVADFKTIDTIFNEPAVCDAPVRVVVVCGPPRVGKSTFANILYYNEEDIEIGEEVTGDEKPTVKPSKKPTTTKHINKVFETSNAALKPSTNGIWITQKPIAVKSMGKLLYNTFIVDVEGIFGPNAQNKIQQQLFVLSALMATHFVYIDRKSSLDKSLEILMSYSTLAKDLALDLHKLIVVVNDFPSHGKEFKLGSKSTEEFKANLKIDLGINLGQLTECFSEVQCFLLPEPDDLIRNGSFDDSQEQISVKDIGDLYHTYCRKFRNKFVDKQKLSALKSNLSNISSFNINKSKYHFSGDSFSKYAKHICEEIKLDKLKTIQSSLVLQADRQNSITVNKLIDNYNQVVSPLITEIFERLQNTQSLKSDLSNLEEIHRDKLQRALDDYDNSTFSKWNTSPGENYRKKLNEKLAENYTNFEECLRFFEMCFSSYVKQMTEIVRDIDIWNTENFVTIIRAKHRLLSEKYEKRYSLITPKIQGYDFSKVLANKIEKYFANIELITVELKLQIKCYSEKLNDEYEKKSWYSKLFLSSNQWISSHNDVIEEIVDKFRVDIENKIESESYLSRIYEETERFIQTIYDERDKKEKIGIGVAVSSGLGLGIGGGAAAELASGILAAGGIGSLAVGGVAMIGGIIWGVYKWSTKESINRKNTKKFD